MAEIASPISGGIQVAKSTVSSGVFGIGRTALQPAKAEPDPETLGILRQNQTSLLLISKQLEGLSFRMTSFGNSLDKVSNLIETEGILERQREVQKQAQERQLAEQQLREGKESIIERKIQAALLQPVQTVGQKVRGVLGSLMEFFTTLLGGWLINQGIETIKALAEGNRKKLEQIKDDTLGQLGIIGRIFTLIRTGFFGTLKTITSLTGRVTSAVAAGLFINPMRALAQAFRGGGGGGKPSQPPRGPRGPAISGGLGSLTGNLVTIASGLMNYFNGENMDAVLAAATILGPGKFIKIAASLGYAADEIAELFGSNIFGKDPKKLKQANDIKIEAEKEANKSGKTSSSSTKATEVNQIQKPTESVKSTEKAPESQSVTPASSGVSTPMMSMLPGMTNETSTEPTNLIKVSGLRNQIEESEENIQISPVNPQSTQQKVETLSSLSEPQPNVVMLPPQQPPSIISKSPSASGDANTVPSISSSNPENFYVLYSQIHYNVVM